MPTSTQYIETLKDAASTITGNTAPTTGQYYNYIYSQNDPNTGVPTLDVHLYKNQPLLAPATANINSPLPLNNLTDAQILEMIQNGQQVMGTQQKNSGNTLNVRQINNQEYGDVPTSVAIPGEQVNEAPVTGSELPIGGIFTLVLLLLFVGFVYFLIRMWQDHQAQKLVMMQIKKRPTQLATPVIMQEQEVPTKPLAVEAPEVSAESATDEAHWRKDIESANKKLESLLEEKGIKGETISDKLKAVKPGQFALADMAWEAQQGAKGLLTAHDTDASEQAIKRTLQLFKQVFAEHGVV